MADIGAAALQLRLNAGPLVQGLEQTLRRIGSSLPAGLSSLASGAFQGLVGGLDALGQGQVGRLAGSLAEKLRGGLHQIQPALTAAFGPVGTVMGQAGDAFLQFGSIVAREADDVVRYVHQQAAAIVELANAASLLRVPVNELAAIGISAGRAGLGMEEVTHAMQHLQRTVAAAALGDEELAFSFRQLGLSASELVNIPVNEQLSRIQQGMARLGSTAQQNRLSHEIFGRSGQSLLNFLRQGAEVQDQSRALMLRIGLDPASQVDMAREVMAAFRQLQTLADAFGQQLAGVLMPPARNFVNLLFEVGVALSPIWRALLDVLPQALGGIADPITMIRDQLREWQPTINLVAGAIRTIGPAFREALDPATLQALNNVLQGLATIGLQALVGALITLAGAIQLVAQVFAVMLNVGMSVVRALGSATLTAVALMMEGLSTVLQQLQAPIVAVLTVIRNAVADMMHGIALSIAQLTVAMRQIPGMAAQADALWNFGVAIGVAGENLRGINIGAQLAGATAGLDQAAARIRALRDLLNAPAAPAGALSPAAIAAMNAGLQVAQAFQNGIGGRGNAPFSDLFENAQNLTRLFQQVRNQQWPMAQTAERGSAEAVQQLNELRMAELTRPTEEEILDTVREQLLENQRQRQETEQVRTILQQLLQSGQILPAQIN